ncbi:MAG: aminotransferase class V-fold PLP-dependent enzyme [bacterium]
MLTAEAMPLVEHETPRDFLELRAREFARLDAGGHAYLDFTGSALYPESLVRSHGDTLRSGVFGNPHAENPTSLASTSHLALARSRVLRFMDADPAEYTVVFTANATAALAHVATSYPFGPAVPLVLSVDNHNSVNGIREYAMRAGATVHYLPLDAELRLHAPDARLQSLRQANDAGGLMAFPAQSNFSGVKHPLALVTTAQSLGFRVLLDAAALLPMTRLSLRDVPADFVALSFYKMFGYPTGVGALVARRDALSQLRRPWFSGGTVDFVSVQNVMHALRAGEEGFEDGTPDFLGISAIPAGLQFLEDIGLPRIERHSMNLTVQLIAALTSLRHRNGQPLVHVYGPQDARARGATVAFNVLNDAGSVVPFQAVERRAHVARVSVRGGCFCNPGASETAFGFPAEATAQCLVSTRMNGWALSSFAECMRGYPVGAVRASFGMASNRADALRLLSVVESFVDD